MMKYWIIIILIKDGKYELLALTGVNNSVSGHGTYNGALWLVNSNSIKIVDYCT